MFRVYRSIGGDSAALGRRQFAARCMAYLMLRAVGTLTPMSNPSSPAQFLTALITADSGNWTSEGIFGGAYNKVLTWSFEKQNLNGGAKPSIDVYIDDGRAGVSVSPGPLGNHDHLEPPSSRRQHDASGT